MRNLVIDIGNTNSKLAVFEAKEMLYFQRYELLDETILAEIIAQYQVKNATISTVRQDSSSIAAFLKDKVNYFPFTSTVNVGIVNNYQTPATLGLDRWAKVIAAYKCYPRTASLLIDAGTCITYDLLTENGVYNGGSISLGYKMRFKALNHYTGRLPLIDWDKSEEIIPEGSNTVDALKRGVLQGILNEIEGYIALENKNNSALSVIITGGDADFLNKQLKNSIFATQIKYDPFLVLKGLNEVITS